MYKIVVPTLTYFVDFLGVLWYFIDKYEQINFKLKSKIEAYGPYDYFTSIR